jgi:hypothetical protein
VVYLLIMVLVAGAGITRLWLMQRRQRAHLETVDGFRSSLQRISEQTRARPAGSRRSGPSRPHVSGPRPHAAVHRPRPVSRSGAIDPARRAAAKRRIEARRRARARAAR